MGLKKKGNKKRKRNKYFPDEMIQEKMSLMLKRNQHFVIQQISIMTIKILVWNRMKTRDRNGPTCWMKKKRLEEVEEVYVKIKENATIKRWKRMTWAREKISIASRRQFHMQNPTEFDYYQRGLHVRKSKGRISKPRGYLHRCIRSLSLTKYNNATR